MMTARAKKKTGTIIIYIILLICVAIMLFPIIWLILTSLKIQKDYYSSPPIWIPVKITFNHYQVLFTTYGAFPFIKNSIIIATGNTLLVLLLGIPTAYAIARHSVGGKNLAFYILSQRMLPPVAAIIPLFIIFSKIHLLDTYLGLILTYSIFNLSFAVWMLIGFFHDTPKELFEAAMLDGCNEIQTIQKIIIPIIAPGIVVVALFCFIFAWNELMFAMTFSRERAKTLMMLITSTMQSPTGIFFGEAAGAGVIALVPPFILTLFFQKYLVRGLSFGAVKG